MKKGINIFSPEWINIVFAGKNKEYGAFQLRLTSNKRHRNSMLIAFAIFIFTVCSPMLIKAIIPKVKEQNLEVITLADLTLKQEKQQDQPKEIYVPPPPVRSQIKFTAPIITNEDIPVEEQMKTQDEILDTKITIGAQNVQGVDTLPPDITDLEKETAKQQIVEVETLPFAIVEEQPLFPGGEEALLAWITKNTHYPDEALEAGVSGKVYVGFVISQKGKVTDVKLLRGVSPVLDDEAVRVVKLIPDWTPGRQSGRPVRVSFQVPVSFILH